MTPILLPITKIQTENSQVKTFFFDYPLQAKPGQFVMLWIPGVDQKPFSVGYQNDNTFGLTVFKRGPLTEKLFTMKVGERVGITGPFGTAFTTSSDLHYIMVAGGYGAAPLGFLAESLPCHLKQSEGSTIDFLIGARNKNLLLFKERLLKIPNLKLHIATDDGSYGYKGYVTDMLLGILKHLPCPCLPTGSGRQGVQDDNNNSKTLVVTCGPELMEKKVLDMCNEKNIDCEISIERYMKCGFGVCGQCVVDGPGICMCQQGPVVKRELANQITEFGKYHRDKTGAIVNL